MSPHVSWPQLVVCNCWEELGISPEEALSTTVHVEVVAHALQRGERVRQHWFHENTDWFTVNKEWANADLWQRDEQNRNKVSLNFTDPKQGSLNLGGPDVPMSLRAMPAA